MLPDRSVETNKALSLSLSLSLALSLSPSIYTHKSKFRNLHIHPIQNLHANSEGLGLQDFREGHGRYRSHPKASGPHVSWSAPCLEQ